MNLTPNFTTGELNFDAAPPAARVNLQQLARLLERVRELGGSRPLVITSGYRAGDPKQHGSGSAADFRAPGFDCVGFANKVLPLLSSSEFGQVIIYPYTDRHVHIGLPNGSKRGDIRVETGKGVYTSWRPGTPLPPWGGAAGTADASSPSNEGAASLEGLVWLVLSAVLTYWLLGGR